MAEQSQSQMKCNLAEQSQTAEGAFWQNKANNEGTSGALAEQSQWVGKGYLAEQSQTAEHGVLTEQSQQRTDLRRIGITKPMVRRGVLGGAKPMGREANWRNKAKRPNRAFWQNKANDEWTSGALAEQSQMVETHFGRTKPTWLGKAINARTTMTNRTIAATAFGRLMKVQLAALSICALLAFDQRASAMANGQLVSKDDLGGPGYRLVKGRVVVWGIDSAPFDGESTCSSREVYAKVAAEHVWIGKIIAASHRRRGRALEKFHFTS